MHLFRLKMENDFCQVSVVLNFRSILSCRKLWSLSGVIEEWEFKILEVHQWHPHLSVYINQENLLAHIAPFTIISNDEREVDFIIAVQ